MAEILESGASMEKFVLRPNSSSRQLPLSGLTFSVKDIFDVDGYVTGFGNPDWKRTHSAAVSTAPAVLLYSAASLCAGLVDFSLGTDTGGSLRAPASYCGILGFRPSLDAISTSGVIPMSQSFDIAQILKHVNLGNFEGKSTKFAALNAYGERRSCVYIHLWLPFRARGNCLYEFKKNHAEWITTVNPKLDLIRMKASLFSLQFQGGYPPKLQWDPPSVEVFHARAFSLLSVAGVAGFCQVNIPLGMYNNLPVSISLVEKHGSDGFLLNLVENLYDTIQTLTELSFILSNI
ncbi:hypothetical protein F3Y22_tig00111671pilonHSYRG00059 [Hibiscus syriacus]|uniref:Amidase domain-containing protein n=1 Tax=Hibiscus syriacus TaxID=106335 RepID=A0A6A2Y3S3_HIBSY|nr:hypothetical protein F3Y22_tig00111671pilonHSYRG00059 [Hibiscus syriacus]